MFDKYVDNYMNAEPLIPLPKENNNKPLVIIELMMLWLIWASGLIAGLFLFILEQIVGHMKRHKHGRQQDTIYPLQVST